MKRRRDPDKCRRCRFGHIAVTDAGPKGWTVVCLFCGAEDHLKDIAFRGGARWGSSGSPAGGDAA